jgi:hypothetical protein
VGEEEMKKILFLILVLILPLFADDPYDVSNCFLLLDGAKGVTVINDSVSAWADQSGTNNNFSQSAQAQRPKYIVSDSALSWDGGDRLSIPANATGVNTGLNDVTMEMYIYMADYTPAAFTALFSKYANTSNRFNFCLNTTGTIRTQGSNAGVYAWDCGANVNSFTDGVWYFVSIQVDKSDSVIIRVNNQKVASTTTAFNAGTSVAVSSSAELGAQDASGWEFTGKIRNVRMSTRFLSSAERLAYYNYCISPKISSVTPSSGSGTVNANIAGFNYKTGATANFIKSGQSDISCTSVTVASINQITCSANFAGAEAGYWSLVVANTDGLADTLNNAFTVSEDTGDNNMYKRFTRWLRYKGY